LIIERESGIGKIGGWRKMMIIGTILNNKTRNMEGINNNNQEMPNTCHYIIVYNTHTTHNVCICYYYICDA
jgi:hypothetical protein